MAEELVIRVIDEGGTPSGGAAPASPRPLPEVPTGRPARPAAPATAAPAPRPRASVSGVAQTAATAAGSAGIGAAIGAVVTTVATAMGPLGVAAIGVTAAFTGAALTINQAARAIRSEVDRLSEFSGRVAQTRAESQSARDLAFVRRAGALGGDLSTAERLRSRFEVATIDLQTELLAAVLKIVVELEDFVNPAIDLIESAGDAIAKISTEMEILRVLWSSGTPAQKLAKVAEILIEFKKRADADDGSEIDGLIDKWLAQAGVEDRDPGAAAGVPLVAPSLEDPE